MEDRIDDSGHNPGRDQHDYRKTLPVPDIRRRQPWQSCASPKQPSQQHKDAKPTQDRHNICNHLNRPVIFGRALFLHRKAVAK